MNKVKLKSVLKSLKTGLNPRKNFVLNTPDAKNWYITVRELNGNGIDFLPQTDRVSDEGLRLINNRSNLEIGDVLFSGTGSIGKTAIVSEEPKNWNIKEGVYALKPDGNVIDPRYLLYTLQYYAGMNAFTQQAAGSTVFSIPMKVLGEIKINLPLMSEQKAVSRTLFLIDKKLDINNKINTKLEEIARLLYDQWFVQFDFPDANNRPYKTAGGAMVYNKELKRKIPAGWQIKKLGDLISIDRGISYTSKEIVDNSGIPMINLASIDTSRNYRVGSLKFFSGKYKIDKIVTSGDLLMACTDLTRNADIIGSPILVPEEYDEYLYSMDLARINISKDLVDMYLYESLRTDSYHNYIKWFASGTNVLHLDISGVNWYKILIPQEPLQEGFSKINMPLRRKQAEIINENQRLKGLRDYLLPMLMNGQVVVKD